MGLDGSRCAVSSASRVRVASHQALAARLVDTGRTESSRSSARWRRGWTLRFIFAVLAWWANPISADCARADEPRPGQKVFQTVREVALDPTPGATRATPVNVIYVYDVKRADGHWLFVMDESKTESGWVNPEEVVTVDTAVDFFTRAINDWPRCAFYYVMRAKAYRLSNRFDETLRDLEAASRLAPSDPSPHVHKSALFEQKCDHARLSKRLTPRFD